MKFILNDDKILKLTEDTYLVEGENLSNRVEIVLPDEVSGHSVGTLIAVFAVENSKMRSGLRLPTVKSEKGYLASGTLTSGMLMGDGSCWVELADGDGVLIKSSTLPFVCHRRGALEDIADSGTGGDSAYEIFRGSDGKSAYELAVESGFEGTLSDWLDSLVMITGENYRSVDSVSRVNDTLVITYSDGSFDSFVIFDGRGIASMELDGDGILVTYTDGGGERLALPPMPSGRGISSLELDGDMLTVSYTDGTEDALKLPLPDSDAISSDEKGAPGGVASLGDDGRIPEDQLPDGVGAITVSDAEVGEVLKVSALDGDGRVTAWGSASMPSKLTELENDLYYSREVELAQIAHTDFSADTSPEYTGYAVCVIPKIENCRIDHMTYAIGDNTGVIKLPLVSAADDPYTVYKAPTGSAIPILVTNGGDEYCRVRILLNYSSIASTTFSLVLYGYDESLIAPSCIDGGVFGFTPAYGENNEIVAEPKMRDFNITRFDGDSDDAKVYRQLSWFDDNGTKRIGINGIGELASVSNIHQGGVSFDQGIFSMAVGATNVAGNVKCKFPTGDKKPALYREQHIGEMSNIFVDRTNEDMYSGIFAYGQKLFIVTLEKNSGATADTNGYFSTTRTYKRIL